MGVVHLTKQRSLDRDVAVKTILASDASMARALVREARIMGSLEHPNLVPVHALGVDGAGAPVLVMKRIEGVSWRVLLADPEHEGWKPLLVGHDDPLRANVEILSHVCRALAFAHDRGVIHRDLKPENVMIGRFGEVYLLDWGLALRLSEREGDVAGIVGTPGYLAPEMAHGDPRLVDARTDVYLLGGALYEVLTGRMPHEAPTPMAALVAALMGSTGPIPSDAPRELADLARHAMASAPADRVPGAEAFREGLARFLASREVDRAVAEARLALARARESIARDGSDSLDAFRALIEARFAFGSAHRSRPHDAAIRADLDACIGHLVEREIAVRSPVGARTLLGELGTPDPDLEARVDALERGVAAERAAAEVLLEARRAADTSAGLRAMRAVVLVTAGWMIPAYSWFAWETEARGRELPIAWLIATNVFVLLGVLLAIFLGRRTILANEGSRRHAAFAALVALTLTFCSGVAIALGGTMSAVVPQTLAALACVLAAASLTITRELWPSVVVYLAGVCAAFALPRWAVAVSLPVSGLVLLIWWRAIRLHAARSLVTSVDARTNRR